MKFEIKGNLHTKSGVEPIDMQTTLNPQMITRDSAAIRIASHNDSVSAKACIYCKSEYQLSNEHVIPYALGGTVQILNGSCEKCRQITQHFENLVLRGEMQNVRYIENLPSRSKHKHAPSTVSVRLEKEGLEVVEDVKISEAPILLSYPLFAPPRSIGAEDTLGLTLMGLATTSHGADPSIFLRNLNKDSMTLIPPKISPMAFARMIAKIGYGFAWISGMLDQIANPKELPEAIISSPDKLGKFISTKPEPYEIFPGILHRFNVFAGKGHFYAEVQLFAEAGAPTYFVALGSARPDEGPQESAAQ